MDKCLRKDVEDLLVQNVPEGTLWGDRYVTVDRVKGSRILS